MFPVGGLELEYEPRPLVVLLEWTVYRARAGVQRHSAAQIVHKPFYIHAPLFQIYVSDNPDGANLNLRRTAPEKALDCDAVAGLYLRKSSLNVRRYGVIPARLPAVPIRSMLDQSRRAAGGLTPAGGRCTFGR